MEKKANGERRKARGEGRKAVINREIYFATPKKVRNSCIYAIFVVVRHAPSPLGWVPSESTFALPCKLQAFNRKILLMRA